MCERQERGVEFIKKEGGAAFLSLWKLEVGVGALLACIARAE